MKLLHSSTLPASRDLPTTFEELVRMYPPHAVRDEGDYDQMQEVIDRLTSIPEPTEDQWAYLDTLTILFSAYEQEHYPIEIDDVDDEDDHADEDDGGR